VQKSWLHYRPPAASYCEHLHSSRLGESFDDQSPSRETPWDQSHQPDLDYHGSITLDPEHCEAAGIYPLEFVDIWNKNSGARISTYVVFGDRG